MTPHASLIRNCAASAAALIALTAVCTACPPPPPQPTPCPAAYQAEAPCTLVGAVQNATVSAKANIYGSGIAGLPGGGVTPVALTIPAGADAVVLPTVTGSVDNGCCPTANGPDGTDVVDANLGPLAGLSSLTATGSVFMVGVFLAGARPATAPPGLDLSVRNTATSFAPVAGQLFAAGDGRTDGAIVQTFRVPAGATTLYLGFADGTLSGTPGANYADNVGSLATQVQFVDSTL